MKWYKDLYVGESIAEKSEKVKRKILRGALQVHIYVITLPSNQQNLLDIIPVREIQQKYYPKKDLYVIGLAKGREEAEQVAANLLSEVYFKTGGFDLLTYLKIAQDQSGSAI
jgi:hypothetical protein